MGQFADNTAERARKLNGLVAEMKTMDRFRDSAKLRCNRNNRKVTVVISDKNGDYSTKIDIDSFDGLTENVLGLTDLAINKRYDEIREVLDNEYGGAYTEVNDDK